MGTLKLGANPDVCSKAHRSKRNTGLVVPFLKGGILVLESNSMDALCSLLRQTMIFRRGGYAAVGELNAKGGEVHFYDLYGDTNWATLMVEIQGSDKEIVLSDGQ